MSPNIQVTFRGVSPSEELQSLVRAQAHKLERFHAPVDRCHVVVEAPGAHHRSGEPLRVHLQIAVRGTEVTVRREPLEGVAHEDASDAIRDAFRKARHELQHRAGREASRR